MAGSHILKVSLITDDSKFKSGMQGADKSASILSTGLKALGVVSVAALSIKALRAVKDFAGDSIRAFSDLNESTNAVTVTFGKNADGIKRLGEQAARSVGLSNSQFNQYAVSLSAFAEQIAGQSGDVVGTIDTLSKRVADFASVMNLDIGDAMGKFQSGLAGQSRPLREFGIDVSDARVKAFALANGIGEVGREMTEAEKVQARYGTIMEQTAKVQGDFANTSDQLANKERILNAELENSKAVLGAALAPAKNLFLGMQSWGVKAITEVAFSLNFLTGAWDLATLASERFKKGLQDGRSISESYADGLAEIERELRKQTAAGALAASSYRDQEEGAAAAADAIHDLTRDLYEHAGGVDEATKALNELYGAGRITADQWQDMVALLNQHHTKALERNTEAVYEAYRNQMLYGEGLDEANEEIEEQVDLLKELADASRSAVTALDGLLEKTQDLTAAEDAYNEAVKKFGPNSQEAQDAAMGLLQARAAAEAEWSEFFTTFPQGFEQAFRHLVDSGIAPATARAMVEAWQTEFNRTPLALRMSVPEFTMVQRGQNTIAPSKTGSHVIAHDGGVIPGAPGSEVMVKAMAGETVLPTHKPNQGLGGNTYHITVNALDPQAAAQAVVEALQEFERTSGAVPINVRTG